MRDGLKVDTIRSLAISNGIVAGKHTKADLVKLTRLNEGKFDCFASAYAGVCDQEGCLWRNTCFSATQQGV